MSNDPKAAKIAELNDQVRRTFTGGQIMFTSGIACLEDEVRAKVLTAFREFNDFDKDNDPHSEHDFCSFEVGVQRIFAKCDYYDLDMRYLSDDPSDPAKTKRVWTLMLAEEY